MTIQNAGGRKIKVGASHIFQRKSKFRYCTWNAFKLLLDEQKTLSSMSRKGDCWDNAVAESFFKTLKCELVYHRKFCNKVMATLEVFGHIEGGYNKERRHSSLGYLTSNEMEKLFINMHPSMP